MRLKANCPYCESWDITIKEEQGSNSRIYYSFCECCEQKGPPRLTKEAAMEAHNIWIELVKKRLQSEQPSLLKRLFG